LEVVVFLGGDDRGRRRREGVGCKLKKYCIIDNCKLKGKEPSKGI